MFKNTIGLLRTNPKLSSNAKLIVDSNQRLYLGAFRANASLSQERYQKWAVNGERDWSRDLAIFFNNVKKEERYQVLEKHSNLSVLNDFSYQYEDQYQYGARFNDTKLYEEQYRFLAPIWIDKTIPKKFIIYRVKGVDFPLSTSLSVINKKVQTPKEWNQNDKVLDLLANATIVKTFDLERGSNLGEYLHRHFTNDSLPYAPLSFNFQADRGWSFNGIDLMNGGFVSKREYKSEEYIAPQNLEIYSNRFITEGFERYGVVSSNLINLEFMFDDPEANDYEVYRYFGLYVDPIYEGSFALDQILDSTFVPNLNTVETVYDTWNQAAMLPLYEFTPIGGEFPIMNWVQDKNLDYYHVQNNPKGNFLVAMNKKTILNFSGKGKTGRRVKIDEQQNNQTNFFQLKFEYAPNDWDRYFIGIQSELKNGSARVNDFFILADPTLSAGSIAENRFSNQGTLKQITKAFANVISNTTNLFSFKTKVIGAGESILVYDYAEGFNTNATLFGISEENYNTFGDNDGALTVVQGKEYLGSLPESANSSGYRMYCPVGGASGKKLVLLPEKEIENIKIGEYLKIQGKETYCKILDLVKNPEEEHWRVILDKPFEIKRLELDVFEDYRVKWGKFSAYDLNDFDFDFYSTSNSQLGELEHESQNTQFQKLTPILGYDNPDFTISMPEISTEYDRLFENELTETATLSRVVPWISKFRIKNVLNGRNLPYILNTNEAFGESNMSPVINNLAGRNPIYFNMEHFHIFDVPSYLKTKDLQSYLNFDNTENSVVDLMKDLSGDQFYLYFHRSGQISLNDLETSNVWIDNKVKPLYSEFNFGSTAAYPYAIFRGLRYVYKQRKENQQINPVDFIQNSNINEYKFGVVSRVVIVDNSPGMTKIKVIKNEKWKFICAYIEVEIPTVSQTDFDRTWFYTAQDLDSNTPLDVLFLWNTVDFNGTNPSDRYLKASTFGGRDPRFTQTIIKNPLGGYYPIVIEWEEGGSTYKYTFTPIQIINDTTIEINGAPTRVSGPGAAILNSPTTQIPTGAIYSINDSGQGRLASVLENITVNRFAARFNQFEDIEYVTVQEDGTEIINEFVLEVQDGTPFNKISNLTYKSDQNRPAAYQLASGEIGKQVVEYESAYVRVLKRMNGEYIPLFRDVVTFTDVYNEQKKFEYDEYILDQDGYIDFEYIIKYFDWILDPVRRSLIYKKFKNTGISFASYKLPYLQDYAFINNYFYHKANERTTQNILRLSESSDKLPLYPKIGEIAIDKKRFNVLDSKWSKKYYTRALKGGGSDLVDGTLNPVESSSFLASTIMKVLNEYTLSDWSVLEAPTLLTLDIIRFAGNAKGVHWSSDSKQIWADFYLDHILYENISSDILPFFTKNVDSLNSFNRKDSLLDDIEVYVKQNIANRFVIDFIQVFAIESTTVQNNFIPITNGIISPGFTQINPTIFPFSNRKLGFRLIYNKREGYNYQFQVITKIKA